jgi:adenine-specific DNA-methyltransferase
MSQNFEKLKDLLKTLFQLDQPDLDFGLYRIMHAKSAEITQFLDQDLLPQVVQAFSQYQPADKAEIQKALNLAIEQARALGADPETLPKVKELRERLANEAVDLNALESEVYDRLYSFFRRYYDEGDFLSKRVYKPGVYAIPYEGEETKFTWANQDQYYIKTSEYLRDYAFRLRPEDVANPMRVHFRLVDAAEGEHGNVKTAEGKERLFFLAPAGETGRDFVSILPGENGQSAELEIRFEYRPAAPTDWLEKVDSKGETKKKAPTQKDLRGVAVESIRRVEMPEYLPWLAELSKPHIRKDGTAADYSRLEAHLDSYTKRNAFDYFIHKDLGGFLRRELDFYIKNEIMHLDDVENETALRAEQYLSKIKVVRAIAGKIIAFLAQLEDFQKKLWLKKKFVIETNYCITLDRIPEKFYPEIAVNEAQVNEWVTIFAIDQINMELLSHGFSRPLSVAFLKENQYLSIDTRFYSADFVSQLLESLGSSDGELDYDGICMMGDNFHVLSLAQSYLRHSLRCIYIDPPYNTDATPIAYKNGYRHSSWLAMMDSRLHLAYPLLSDSAIMCVTIDDVEVHALRTLLESSFPDFEPLGVVPIKNNPAGRTGTVGFSICHEYAIFYGAEGKSKVGRLEHSEEQKARYKEQDEAGFFEWTNFRKHGGLNTYRVTRPRQYYPIYVSGESVRIPEMEWDAGLRDWNILEQPTAEEAVLYPIDEKGRERIWDFIPETARGYIRHFKVRPDATGQAAVYRKWRINREGLLPQTWWDKSEYSAAEYGTNLLTNMFGETHRFTFPKSVHAVRECLLVSGMRSPERSVVLDFFAGSGTTAHAVLNLNREDGGQRRYVLADAADYFDSVLLPRIRKAAYAESWKDGKPENRTTGQSHFIKYCRLESYEDCLASLNIVRTETQRSLLAQAAAQGEGGFREQYILKYMLNVETRGSQSLLNMKAIADPTAYKLLVKRPGTDESRETNVDLLETFNWLIGLCVKHIAAPQRFSAEFEHDAEGRLTLTGRLKMDANGPWWFRRVEGTTPDGRNTLIVWRKLTGKPEQDNLMLDSWMKDRLKISTRDFEFDLIYVNGDNNLENLKLPNDTWKVRLIEEDFHRLMFDTEGL